MARHLISGMLLLAGISLLTACTLFSRTASIAQTHPVPLPPERPICSSCHEAEQLPGALKPYASFNHTPAYVKRDHRYAATRDAFVCGVCHAQSFCADCHAGYTEIKPSVKTGRADRDMPHRGDFLTLHRIEGKMNPAACYTCHGRSNNEKCTGCHGQQQRSGPR